MLGLPFFAALAFALQNDDGNEGEKRQKPKRVHKCWTRPWLQRRDDIIAANTLYHLRLEIQVCNPFPPINQINRNVIVRSMDSIRKGRKKESLGETTGGKNKKNTCCKSLRMRWKLRSPCAGRPKKLAEPNLTLVKKK